MQVDETVTRPAPAAVSGTSTALLAARRAKNRAAAAELEACVEILRTCLADVAGSRELDLPRYAVLDPWDLACDQIVAALAVTSGQASALLDLAHELHTRYPALRGAMRSGELDERVVSRLCRLMRAVEPEHAGRVEAEVVRRYLDQVRRGRRLGDRALERLVADAARPADPDAILRRRRRARADRRVTFRPAGDGMCDLYALLPAPEAATLAARLSAMAEASAEAEAEASAEKDAAAMGASRAQVAAGSDGFDATDAPGEDSPPEPRTHAQREADALVALALGPASILASTPASAPATNPAFAHAHAHAHADVPAPPVLAPAPVVLRPQVTVIGASGFGAGARVEFARTGESSVEALTSLLARSSGATFECTSTDVEISDRRRAGRYTPSPELARRVRLRDGTCRHPGCSVPAARCDIDHVTPFDHREPEAGGATSEANLMCLCRRHHRVKTFGENSYALGRHGELHVTTAQGVTLTTAPGGALDIARSQETSRCGARHEVYRPTGVSARSGARPSGATAASAPDVSETAASASATPAATPAATFAARRAQRVAAERAENARLAAHERLSATPHPHPPGSAHPDDDEPPPF